MIGDLPALRSPLFVADVNANDFVAIPGEAGGGSHADVTKSKHRNFIVALTSVALRVALERAEQGQAKGLLPAVDWVPICEYSVMN